MFDKKKLWTKYYNKTTENNIERTQRHIYLSVFLFLGLDPP